MKCRHHCQRGWVWTAEDEAHPCPLHATIGQRAIYAYEEARHRIRKNRRDRAQRRLAKFDDLPF